MGCSLAYLPETPAPQRLEHEFEWEQTFARDRRARWRNTPLMRAWTLLVLTLKPGRDRRALRRIRRYARTGRLLDIGCGAGRLSALALQSGFDPLGVELSPRMAAKARGRLGADRVRIGRLQDCNLPAGGFDVAVSISYIEHDPDPLPVMRHVHVLLRPGGVCLHKTPNYNSLLRRVLGRRWSGYRWPEHVQYFTPATLGRLMEKAGFEVLDTRANPLGDNFWLAARKPPAAAK